MELRKCSECGIDYPLYKFFNGNKKSGEGRKLVAKCHHCRYRQRLANNPQHLRKRDLWKKYRLTTAQYSEMIEAQNQSCALCNEPTKEFVVDHDHSCCPTEITCGKCIRGLLCHLCNRGIGQFNDDIKKLLLAVDYLTKWKPKSPK